MAALDFVLPPELSATGPPEERGLARDEVRLLIAGGDGVHHAQFHQIAQFLSPGDVVVVNTSATLAAAVDGVRPDDRPVTVHFATPGAGGEWLVELRRPDSSGPTRDTEAGEQNALPRGVTLRIIESQERFARARLLVEGPVEGYLAQHGRPISYTYLRGRWPLAAYQTVFAREPRSAEMPSAGRPFTPEVVTDVVTRGIVIAPI